MMDDDICIIRRYLLDIAP